MLNNLQLRKITERVRPQIGPKADERGSLLEQIRTKVRADCLGPTHQLFWNFCLCINAPFYQKS